MNPFYREYSDYLAERYNCKVQKLTVDTGAICPNRDGTLGYGGCVYCSNSAFSPVAGSRLSVSGQLQRGKIFFASKYPSMRFLAYFQGHTSTYADERLFIAQCREAMQEVGVVGLVIGTRPDCMSATLLSELSRINREIMPVMVEYGMESAYDATLQRVNRCHTHADTVAAVTRTHNAGIDVGVHLIFGLPGENEDMMLNSVDAVNALPVSFVKFHQLQIVRGTRLAVDIASGVERVRTFSVDEYVELCCKVVARLRRDIAIDRFTAQSPQHMLIAPLWGLKNHEFISLLQRRLMELASSHN